MWNGLTSNANKIIYGTLGEERTDRPGLYIFYSTSGVYIRDAQMLSPVGDNEGNGDFAKPVPGSTCIALFTDDGADCYVCGFTKPATFNEDEDGDAKIEKPADNAIAGDRVISTSGGARIILKRGGATMIEGGPGVTIIMNPLNNAMSVRSANFAQTVDGFRAVRGRKEKGGTSPETLHEEEYLSAVGVAFDRERVSHGSYNGDGRRRFTLEDVTIVAGKESATLKIRETYNRDGSWLGEGVKYQWGAGADEPIVLGNALVTAMNKLMDIVKNLKVNTAWGPSTPPIPPTPIDIEALKSELAGKILSTYLFSTKDPTDL